jgi:peptide/nickel transport system substrate-binding protein
VGGQNDQLDPHNYFTRTAFCGISQLFEPLIRRDAQFVPRMWLAEEVTLERPDLWVIRVRDGVEFHNGKKLSADDVMFTLRRIVKLPGADAAGLASIDLGAMSKLDSRTVRVPLKHPDVSFADHLANNNDYIVPVGFDPNRPIGTGPFKFVSRVPSQKMSFARNPSYWQTGKPYLDGLDIVSLTDDTARVNALLGGEVQAIEGVPFGEVSVIQGNSQTKILESRTGQWLPFAMRTDVAPWSDQRVRQALRLIVDREQLVAQGLNGHGRVANDIFAPYDANYDHGLPQRSQDLEQAKSLLKSAGQGDLRATIITSNIYAGLPQQAEILVQQAKSAGVTLSIQQLDPTVFFGPRWLSYPLTQDFWTNRDYFTTAQVALSNGGAYNETHWHDPQWQSLFSQALQASDQTKQAELVHECQAIEYQRGGYIIWGFVNFVDGHSSKLAGLEPDPILPLGRYGFGNAFLT